eukprot:gene19267-biopygen2486
MMIHAPGTGIDMPADVFTHECALEWATGLCTLLYMPMLESWTLHCMLCNCFTAGPPCPTLHPICCAQDLPPRQRRNLQQSLLC